MSEDMTNIVPETLTERLQLAVNEVIGNQLRSNNPPATGAALKRLLAEGFSETEAMRLIGQVVATEVITVIQQGKPYNEARYTAALNALPKKLVSD